MGLTTQQANNLHISECKDSIIIPCYAGCTDEYLAIHCWPDEDEPTFGYLSAHFGTTPRWKERLKCVWEILCNRKSRQEVLVNVETAKSLRDWLSERIQEIENESTV